MEQAKFKIEIKTPLDSEHIEELEDKICRVIIEYEVEGKLKSEATGNEMTCDSEWLRKHLTEEQLKEESKSYLREKHRGD